MRSTHVKYGAMLYTIYRHHELLGIFTFAEAKKFLLSVEEIGDDHDDIREARTGEKIAFIMSCNEWAHMRGYHPCHNVRVI